MSDFVCGLCECEPCRCGEPHKHLTRRLDRRSVLKISLLGAVVTIDVAQDQVTVSVPDEQWVSFERVRA